MNDLSLYTIVKDIKTVVSCPCDMNTIWKSTIKHINEKMTDSERTNMLNSFHDTLLYKLYMPKTLPKSEQEFLAFVSDEIPKCNNDIEFLYKNHAHVVVKSDGSYGIEFKDNSSEEIESKQSSFIDSVLKMRTYVIAFYENNKDDGSEEFKSACDQILNVCFKNMTYSFADYLTGNYDKYNDNVLLKPELRELTFMRRDVAYDDEL